MERPALEEVIDKHTGSIKKYCERLPGCFDQEDLHDLRVDYKKIRAFIRLLQLEKDSGDLQLPDKLKAVYQVGGKVRDLQLFLAQLHTLSVVNDLPACITRWKKQLFAYKEQTVSAIEEVNFKKIQRDITSELPRELQDDTIKKFLHRKIAAIHIILLAADDENDLHSIRKQLKDVIYVIRIFENDWGIPFPINGWNEKKLSELASLLGDFNDRCIAIALLQSGYSEDMGECEKAVLQELQNNWLQQKNAQQQQLLKQVRAFKLEHTF
jgi:CHAD domain-containing protein